MSKKHKKVCRVLNYFENFFAFISVLNCCVSISSLASLVGVPVGIVKSAVVLKIGTSTAGMKKYKSIIKEKRKKCNNIVLLAKTKLSTIKILISRALIVANINHDKFVSVNALREYDERKEEIKNPENAVEYTI